MKSLAKPYCTSDHVDLILCQLVFADAEHSGYLGVFSHEVKVPVECRWCTEPNKAPTSNASVEGLCGAQPCSEVLVVFRGTANADNAKTDVDSAQVCACIFSVCPECIAR